MAMGHRRPWEDCRRGRTEVADRATRSTASKEAQPSHGQGEPSDAREIRPLGCYSGVPSVFWTCRVRISTDRASRVFDTKQYDQSRQHCCERAAKCLMHGISYPTTHSCG